MADAKAEKETKVQLALGLACIGIAVGIFLLPLIGSGMKSFGIDIAVFSNPQVKGGLFTIWSMAAGMLALGAFLASKYFQSKAAGAAPPAAH